MTTLNTIIEEEKKEFDRRIDAGNYESSEPNYHSLKKGTDTLLDESWYPESPYEIDGEKVKDFLTSAMQRAVENERARIRESFDDWFKNGTEDVEDWADRNLPTNQGQISR